MGSKSKAPAPTAQELELQRQQRSELNDLTLEQNDRLKAVKRGRIGRRTLLGSGSELGVTGVRPQAPGGRRGIPGGGGGGIAAGGGGGIMSSGGAVRVPSMPSRGSAR